MPYFPAVGHIDDNLSPEEVMKEYRRRYSLAAYHRRKAAIFEKLGGKCMKCGATTDLHLVRKPLKRGAPEFRVTTLPTMAAAKQNECLKHVDLLCDAHSRKALRRKGVVTHGTYYAAYKTKCPCEECAEYKADYVLWRRNERRRKKAANE